MHKMTSPNGKFGWKISNTIGATPQPNQWTESWPLAGSTSTHLDFGPIWAPTCHTYDTPTRGPDAFTAF